MFEWLVRYPKILVTGPARSGTTLAAEIIAGDTGHCPIHEHEYMAFLPPRTQERQLQAISTVFWAVVDRDRDDPIVVHATAAFWSILESRREDIFVVLLRRPLQEILRSEVRMGLQGNHAHEKYDAWAHAPKPFPHLELEYHELETHSLWQTPSQRTYTKYRPDWAQRAANEDLA